MRTIDIPIATDANGQPIPCPQCRNLLAVAGEKPYCITCAYNRTKAKCALYISTFLTAFWIVLCTVFAFVQQDTSVRAFFAVCSMVIALGAAYRLPKEWRAFRQTSAFAFAGGALPEQPAALENQPSVVLDDKVPRVVRMTWNAGAGLVLLFCMLAGAAAAIYWSHTYAWFLCVTLGFLFVLLAALLYKHYSLVRCGHIVLATVIKQRMLQGEHHVVYEFRDSSGNLRRGRFVDPVARLHERMQFSIYVHPRYTRLHLAVADTWFKPN